MSAGEPDYGIDPRDKRRSTSIVDLPRVRQRSVCIKTPGVALELNLDKVARVVKLVGFELLPANECWDRLKM